MAELLRTAGEVVQALVEAVSGITLPASVPLDRIDRLRDRRERCRNLPCVDPPLGRLLGAVDHWLVQLDQWRRTGAARQRGTAVRPPEHGNDALRDALLVFIRETDPERGSSARRRADADREAEADEYLKRRSDHG